MNHLFRQNELDPTTQLPIVHLPINMNALVLGSFGTGKTAVAIQRANLIHSVLSRSGITPKVGFFCYNRVLKRFISQLQKANAEETEVYTFHSWLSILYKLFFLERLPSIGPFLPDWPKVIEKLRNLEPVFNHIVVDEAQLLTPEMISILSMLSKNMTVFMNDCDLSNRCSTPEDVIDELSPAIFRLCKNYRNPTPISRFIDSLGIEQSKENLVDFRGGSAIRLYKIPEFRDIISMILTAASERKDLNIGILLPPGDNLVEQYHGHLWERRGDLSIQCYQSIYERVAKFNFKRSGVKIMTYMSAYGLEFDTVIIPEVDNRKYFRLNDSVTSFLKLSCSRATKEIILIYQMEKQRSKLLKYCKQILDTEEISSSLDDAA